jgi:tetratricopeptide (TPR) repeat protein
MKTVNLKLLMTAVLIATVAGVAPLRAAPGEIEILESTRIVATEAAEGGDCEETLRLLSPMVDVVLETRDIDSGRLLGWCYGATGQLQPAVAWREQVSRWTGATSDEVALAAALASVGQTDSALRIARDLMGRDPQAEKLAHDILLMQAAVEMDAGQCETTLELIDEAARITESNPDNRQLRAWAQYNCGHLDEARDAFAALYADTLADKAAQGLVVCDYRLRQLEQTETALAEYGGPLVERLPKTALPRDGEGEIDYDKVLLTEDGRITLTPERREWAGLLGGGWSTRRGDGPSELNVWRLPVLEFEYQLDRNRFEFRVTRLDLDSGAMSLANFPVNTPDITGVSITDTESNLWEPVFTWIYATDLIWSLEVGATPIKGEVAPTVQGSIGAAQFKETFGWSLAGVRAPVEQSILSWTGVSGTIDINGSAVPVPFSWGRVTRNGLNAWGYRKISPKWTLSGDMRAGDYRGENVVSNLGGQFYGLAETPWFTTGDSGFWWGPYIYLSGFEKNLGGFAPGHGGYFSPEWLVGSGLSGRWRRGSETDPWYLEVRASGGYQKHKEAATELIPDADLRNQLLDLLGLSESDLGSFSSNSESGVAGTLEIEGLRRISDSRWHWGGYARGRISPEFNNFATMLVLRYGIESERSTVRRHYKEQFQLIDP